MIVVIATEAVKLQRWARDGRGVTYDVDGGVPARVPLVWDRASTANLVGSLAAFAVFMLVVRALFGFGFGLPELAIWLVVLVAGALLIVRRYQRAQVDRSPTNAS
jgi:membrane protein required for beta-lactamase induction